MRSLSKSRKAQFFVLSAFAIVTTIFFLSQWIEPYTITDTSSIASMEEPFIFNNIVEKARISFVTSKDCDELFYNMDEYKNFVNSYARSKNLVLNFTNYSAIVCDAPVEMGVTLKSPKVIMMRKFTCFYNSTILAGTCQ